ncbi:hypothetical protein MPER_12300, partial [Moniliophthora perniciosa FA553]
MLQLLMSRNDTNPSSQGAFPIHLGKATKVFVICFLSTRAPPNNKLHAALREAIQSFTHLQSVSFTPVSYHEDIFVESLKILQNRSTLEELAVNRSCLDELNITNPGSSSGLATLGEEEEEREEEREREPPITKTQLLASFRNLTKLSLHDPTRAILQALIPGWLDALSGKLWLSNAWRVEIGYTSSRKDSSRIYTLFESTIT